MDLTTGAARGALERTQLVLDCLPRAIVVADGDGVILAWNEVAEHLYGWRAEEVDGRSLADVVLRALDSEDVRRLLERVAAGESWSGQLTLTCRDEATLGTYTFVGPLRDESKHVVGVLLAADDIADRHPLLGEAADLSEHLSLALAAGDLGTWRWNLATGVTVWDTTLERIFGLQPGTFDGTFEAWVALLHPDDVEHTLTILDRAVAEKGAYEVEHRVVWPDGSVHWLQGRGKVTLGPAGEVTGTIGCTADVTARKLLEIDVERRVRDAERAATRERVLREQLELLVALDDAALGSDHRALMRAVTAAAVPQLGDWCALYFLPEPGEPVVEIAHRDPTRVEWAKALHQRFRYDPKARRGAAAVIRTGRTEFIPDFAAAVDEIMEAAADVVPREDLAVILDELQLTSAITVPLRTKRGIVGAMQFVTAESERRYDEGDVALAQAAAGRIADAVDNAWMTEQHRIIATTLQAALLPPRLPEIDGVDLAVRYWPAGAVTAVGGDFYDVFAIGDRRWSVVIGDVCGTGPDAAAVTAIARHTIRAAATHGAEPTVVLEWVNDALAAGNRELFCTAVYSTIEPLEGGCWTYTCVAGGHPLPLVVRANGSTATVGWPGTLLGALPAVEVTAASTTLHPGDAVVLYTDGITDVPPPHLVEPDELHEMVGAAARGAADGEEVAHRLGAALHARLPIARRSDDIALVVLRIAGPVANVG